MAVLFCFPVWINYTPIVGADQYFQRSWAETWTFGSELWKYVVPKSSWLGGNYFRDLRHQSPPPAMEEGWNFPGYTVVFTLLVAVVALLRRSELSKKLHPFVGVSLGLMAFWMILSLAGGPSALVFHAIPSFRCYGRAGLLVVALGSVVAPIVASELVRICRRRRARVILTLGLLALVASDARRAAVSFDGWPAESTNPRLGRLAEPAAAGCATRCIHAAPARPVEGGGGARQYQTLLLVGHHEPRVAAAPRACGLVRRRFHAVRGRPAAAGRLVRSDQPRGAAICGLPWVRDVRVPS